MRGAFEKDLTTDNMVNVMTEGLVTRIGVDAVLEGAKTFVRGYGGDNFFANAACGAIDGGKRQVGDAAKSGVRQVVGRLFQSSPADNEEEEEEIMLDSDIA